MSNEFESKVTPRDEFESNKQSDEFESKITPRATAPSLFFGALSATSATHITSYLLVSYCLHVTLYCHTTYLVVSRALVV